MPLPSVLTTLLYDPLRGFRMWDISELYMGPNTTTAGKIVPNVDDAVMDWERGILRVISVETTGSSPSYVPTLMLVDFNSLFTRNGRGAQGIGLYQPSVLELAFVNTLVIPNTISIDDRYRAYGTETAYAVLFRGSDLSPMTGEVISQVYNGSGQLTGVNITLELLDPNNTAIKRPPVFNTQVTMYDGELVTLVLYTQAGEATGQHPFLVKNTSAIRGLSANTVYIQDVVLVTNMLDATTLDLLNVPSNTPLTGADFQARLLYSDGSTQTISIGSNKCKLYGVDNFNTSLAGENSEVVLTYYPDINEQTINVSNPSMRSISHVYQIRTVNITADYSFKVYVVPKFNVSTQQYSNDYYLTNQAYTVFIKLAPSQITVNRLGGGAINYGINSGPQTLALSVIIADVIPFGFNGYTFVQTLTLTYGSQTSAGWMIDYMNTDSHVYGVTAYAEYATTGLSVLSLRSGAVSVEQWLARLYAPIHAIFNQTLVTVPPTPTHFKLIYHGVESPVRLIADYWNLFLPNDFGDSFINYDTVSIVWLLPTVDVSVYSTLGVSPLRLQNTLA